MSAGQINRVTTWSQDPVVSYMDPKFAWLSSTFFSSVVQFDGEFVEHDIVEGGQRIAPFVSPMAMGRATRERGFRTYQIKPGYIKLLDTVRPQQGFTRRPGETYGGSMSPQQRLAALVAEKILTHREMIETRWEQMAADAIFKGKITIVDDDYPRAEVDFERNPNLTMTVGTLWNANGADPMNDIVTIADRINKISRGAVANTLISRSTVFDVLMKDTKFRDLLNRDKNLSPGTSAFETGPRSSDKAPTFRGRIAGKYDLWTYDGYYEDDSGNSISFVPETDIAVLSDTSIEGRRYHGAIFDMDAGMQSIEVFVKTRDLWNPSGVEVLTQSAPMLGIRRPNASGVLKVL